MTDAADRPVPDEERDVRPEPLVGDEIEVLPVRPPARGQAVRAKRQLDDLAPAGGHRRQRCRRSCPTAGSCSPGGDGWPARHRRSSEPSECPCGSMNPGATTRPATSSTVADLAVRDRRQVADGQDPVAEHADIRRTARAPGPVDDRPATEQQVEGRHPAMVTGPTGLSGRRMTRIAAVASGRLRLPWGYSSAGRAPAWHAEGPGFESP